MQRELAPVFESSFRSPRSAAPIRHAKPNLSDRQRPLVVDLEGALLLRSLLAEGVQRLLRQNPLFAFAILFWLAQGWTVLKRQVLARARLDLSRLPVNRAFLAFIHAQSDLGRDVVLTATIGQAELAGLLRRFPVFGKAILFDDSLESRGDQRAERLLTCFPRGFHYAGSARSDVQVWEASDHIILVNPTRTVARLVRMQGRAVTQFKPVSAQSAGSAKAAHHDDTLIGTRLGSGQALAVLFAALGLIGLIWATGENTGPISTFFNIVVPATMAVILARTLAQNGISAFAVAGANRFGFAALLGLATAAALALGAFSMIA